MTENIFLEIDKLAKEINSHRPFDSFIQQQIKEYYRIGLTYSSNALEGNSLTESETKIVLEEGLTVAGKPLKDHFEAVGHSDAFNFMYDFTKKNDLSIEIIKKLHYLFYFRIDEKNAGIYRTKKAFITGSKYPLPNPDKLSSLMNNMINHLIEIKPKTHPVQWAALAHKEFVFIHPFIDGNGRVARLLMNLLLMQAGYTIAIIPAICRAEYIQALEKAHENDQSFILFIARMVKETQKDYIRLFYS